MASDPRTKIRALLVKAKHAGTPEHEAALSRQIAAQLCAKYGFDLEALEREADVPVRDVPRRHMCPTCGVREATLFGNCFDCMMRSAGAASWGGRPRPAPGSGPRETGTATSTGKARLDHRGCSHEATPAARAKCRRERARQGL